MKFFWPLLLSLAGVFILILIIGIVDISNLDSLLAFSLFHRKEWDINFYNLIGIITSVFIPISAIIITHMLQADRASRLKEKVLLELISKIFALNNFSQSLFSAFQSLPSNKNERRVHQNERYADFVSKYNSFIEAYGKSMIYLSREDTIIESIDSYIKETRSLAIAWAGLYIKEPSRGVSSDFYKRSDKFCETSTENIKQITRSISKKKLP